MTSGSMLALPPYSLLPSGRTGQAVYMIGIVSEKPPGGGAAAVAAAAAAAAARFCAGA